MSAAMEPRIQYAKTSDGVNIAYYAIGHGMPLVIMNLPNSHLHMEWQMAAKLLAMDEADWEFASESLVRYGMGWSDEMSAPAAAALRESIAREKLAQFLEQSRLWDVGGMLHRVTSPTMIVHDKADKRVDLLTAREMASAIPDARIAILDAESRAGRMGQAVSSVLPFLAGRPLIPEQ